MMSNEYYGIDISTLEMILDATHNLFLHEVIIKWVNKIDYICCTNLYWYSVNHTPYDLCLVTDVFLLLLLNERHYLFC